MKYWGRSFLTGGGVWINMGFEIYVVWQPTPIRKVSPSRKVIERVVR